MIRFIGGVPKTEFDAIINEKASKDLNHWYMYRRLAETTKDDCVQKLYRALSKDLEQTGTYKNTAVFGHKRRFFRDEVLVSAICTSSADKTSTNIFVTVVSRFGDTQFTIKSINSAINETFGDRVKDLD